MKPATWERAQQRACVLMAWAVISAPLAAGDAIAAASAWKPDKVVEIVVNTAPGNSPDKTARAIQKILQERRYVEVPITVANKPGGGGAIAYWESALQRVVDTGEWKKDLENNHWVSEYMGSVETRQNMDNDYAQIKAFLVDLDLVK